MKKINILILSVAGASLLTACSGAKQKLGLGRNSPDEFAIVKRAPLEIPPDLKDLPPPRKGAQRPQENTAQESAQKALFGEKPLTEEQTNKTHAAEDALLAKTGANDTDPNIRTIIDEETALYEEEEQAVIDKLLNRKKVVPGSTLDANEEIERLKSQEIPTLNVPSSPAEK